MSYNLSNQTAIMFCKKSWFKSDKARYIDIYMKKGWFL